ncbi:MAG: response regulator transcription factor [Acidobacteriota bacterium]
MTQPPIRVLLADDHPIVRDGLVAIIERQPGMRVAAQVANGLEACEMFGRWRPDVTLMDLRMPVMGGLRATQTICREYPGSRILILTTYDGDEEIFQALRAGACGYMLKDLRGEELLNGIRAAHLGRRVIPSPVASRLAERMAAPQLTPRESDVLRLIVGGFSNKDIGVALGVGEGTVKSHVNKVLRKLDVFDRTQATTIALRRGFVNLGDSPVLHPKLEKSH